MDTWLNIEIIQDNLKCNKGSKQTLGSLESWNDVVQNKISNVINKLKKNLFQLKGEKQKNKETGKYKRQILEIQPKFLFVPKE